MSTITHGDGSGPDPLAWRGFAPLRPGFGSTLTLRADPAGPAPAPFPHPLVALAEALQPLTCRELRGITSTRRKCSKAQLIAALLAG